MIVHKREGQPRKTENDFSHDRLTIRHDDSAENRMRIRVRIRVRDVNYATWLNLVKRAGSSVLWSDLWCWCLKILQNRKKRPHHQNSRVTRFLTTAARPRSIPWGCGITSSGWDVPLKDQTYKVYWLTCFSTQHTIQGKMAYSPVVGRLECGTFPANPKGFWQLNGYGVMAVYKSDWDRFKGKKDKQEKLFSPIFAMNERKQFAF